MKIAINGFGRIGRLVLRRLLTRPELAVVQLNDLTDSATLAHLFKYDSAHGRYAGTVAAEAHALVIDGRRIPVTAQPDPAALNWGAAGVDVVIEATGRFTDADKASLHVQAGARRVVIAAPAKGDIDLTVVLGVNDGDLKEEHRLISNASCTTNCLAPMVKVLDDAFGVEMGFMATVHAYTADQRLVDAPHKDLRRARAAAENIIPTSTGAAKAVGLVIPHLKGKLDGAAYRVPVVDGSLTEFNALLRTEATADAINAAMLAAANGPLAGILEYTTEPLVSKDIVGNPHSCIFDATETRSMGRLVKVVGWYDNEWGYSCRIVDLILRLKSLS